VTTLQRGLTKETLARMLFIQENSKLKREEEKKEASLIIQINTSWAAKRERSPEW
jgi:hypothetical protein